MATTQNRRDEFQKQNKTQAAGTPKTGRSSQSENSEDSSDRESMSHKAGDKMEHAGEKTKNAGAEKLGNTVYKAGSKTEHSQDSKKSRY